MNQLLQQTIWLVPCYPLLGAVFSILWFPSVTRRTGPRPAGYVNLFFTLLTFVHSLWVLSSIWSQPLQVLWLPWLQVAGLDLTLPIAVSSTTVGACVVVAGLNLLSQIYAIGYMEMDWGWARFFSLLGFFEFGMCALVLCDSLFFSYVVLELLTLGTYLLVGFWFNQSLVVTGARDAFLTKRVGDLVLLMGVVALYPIAGTWNFSELSAWAANTQLDPAIATLLGLALLAGPMGKCAQFPLHLWLDEAMEGPLPSSILRNSVVVATGAWVLVKLEPVLSLSPMTIAATIAIGTATALGCTAIAIAQIDAKRALSYCTSAYMGLCFIAVGVHETQLALLLMLTYAIAMALLVMSIGGIIWNSNTQDLRLLGGLWSRRPVSGGAFVVGALSLLAVPPFGTFWAIAQLVDRLWETQPALAVLILLVNGLTAFSLCRTFGLIFGGKSQQMSERSPEIHWPMAIPMTVLMGVAIHLPIALWQWQWLPGWQFLLHPAAIAMTVSSLVGLSLGAAFYLNEGVAKPIQLPFPAVQDFLSYDLYTAKLYKLTIVGSVDSISRITNWFDRYLVDGFGKLFGAATLMGGQSLKYSTSGLSQTYLLTIVTGIAAILLAFAANLH